MQTIFVIYKLTSQVAATGDKMDHFDHQQQMLKKHARKVEKMHDDLESRIRQRHTELWKYSNFLAFMYQLYLLAEIRFVQYVEWYYEQDYETIFDKDNVLDSLETVIDDLKRELMVFLNALLFKKYRRLTRRLVWPINKFLLFFIFWYD